MLFVLNKSFIYKTWGLKDKTGCFIFAVVSLMAGHFPFTYFITSFFSQYKDYIQTFYTFVPVSINFLNLKR